MEKLAKKDMSESKVIASFGEAVKVCGQSTWHVAILASEIQEKKLWEKNGNYKSFDAFLANYGLKPSTIYAYIRAYSRLIDRGVKAEKISEIPPGVGMLISTQADPQKYIDMAEHGSYTSVREQISSDSGKTEKEIMDEVCQTKPCPYWQDCARFKAKDHKADTVVPSFKVVRKDGGK